MSANADSQATMDAYQALGMTETVVYRPAGGPPRTILALVDRDGGQPLGPNARAPSTMVTALNHERKGLDPAGGKLVGSQVGLAEHEGGEPVARSIRRIVTEDSEFVSVAVQ